MTTKQIILGALLGGALAAASYNLFSSKSGKKLRKSFFGNCENISDAVENFASEVKCSLANNMNQQSDEVWKKIASVKKELKSLCNFENKDTQQGLMVGALLGLVTATVGTLAVQAHNSEECDRESRLNSFLAHACKWKNIISTVLETVEKPAQESNNRAKDLLGLAATGINIWQNMQKNK